MSPKAETTCSVVSVVLILSDACWHMLPPGDLLQTAWTLPFLPANSGPLRSLLCSTLCFLLSLSVPLASLLAWHFFFLDLSTPTYQGEVGQSHCVSRSCSCNCLLSHVVSGDPSSTPVGFWISEDTFPGRIWKFGTSRRLTTYPSFIL